jgi:hypothetical protein
MNIAIYVVAVGFVGMGLYALLWPAKIGRFFDVRIESVDGRNETRAVYGGFGIAIAAALLLATRNAQLHDGIVLCVAFALAGMAGGRAISAVVERPGLWPWFFGGIEAIAAGLLFYNVSASMLQGL